MRQPLMFQGVDQIVAEPAQFLPAQIGLEQRLQLLAVFLPYDLSGSDVCLSLHISMERNGKPHIESKRR